MRLLTSVLSLLLLSALTLPAAALEYDQNVTPDVIFGSGNANGFFTTDRAGGVELGLRAKLRFDSNDNPQNVFNSDGAGTYSFAPGHPTNGFSWVADPSTTPTWNFEFTVNTNYDGTSGLTLDDLTYELGLDFDPTLGDNFLIFDPITPNVSVPYYDHSLGDNATTSATDVVAGDGPTYTAGLATLNVAQNSWNYEFFNDGSPWDQFDPDINGSYKIYLRAIDASGNEVARTEIDVDVFGPVATEDATWGRIKALFR